MVPPFPGQLAYNPYESMTAPGMIVNDMQTMQEPAAYPHFVHVPIFRSKKRIFVKKQSEGCCGCLNTSGIFDKPGGLCGFANVGGCLDRDMVVKVDRQGNVVKRR